MLTSQLIQIFPRRTFDLEDLAGSSTESETVARHVPVEGYGQAVVLLRVHGNDLTTLYSATLRCVSEAPTCEDPDRDFLLATDAASLEVDSSTAAGTLLAVQLTPDFSYALRFIVDRTNDDPGAIGGGSVELSADLLLRRGVTRPVKHREVFVYEGAPSTGVYVPFRTATDSGSIGARQTFIAPISGRLELVSLYSFTTAPGTTTVSLHLNGDTTATASVTGDWPADEATDFLLPATARFVAGDRVHIQVDPTSAPGDVTGTAQFEFDNNFIPTG